MMGLLDTGRMLISYTKWVRKASCPLLGLAIFAKDSYLFFIGAKAADNQGVITVLLDLPR
jgi:hypothetical protein